MLQTRITEIRTLAADKALTRKDAQAFIRELCDEVVKLQRRREKNIGPSLHDCFTYGKEIGASMDEATAFHDYHTAKGWKIGREPMRDWQAGLRFWMRNQKKWNGAPVNGKAKVNHFAL